MGPRETDISTQTQDAGFELNTVISGAKAPRKNRHNHDLERTEILLPRLKLLWPEPRIASLELVRLIFLHWCTCESIRIPGCPGGSNDFLTETNWFPACFVSCQV